MRNYCKECRIVAIGNKEVLCKNCKPKKPIDQYPHGTEILWLAQFTNTGYLGDKDVFACKISGTLEEAAAKAQKIAIEYNTRLQCLNRRF